jgi:hypothetical protein
MAEQICDACKCERTKCGKRICRNVNPMDCVEDKCLGEDNVGVLVMEPLQGMMDMGWVFSLRMWPLTCVYHQRYTLAHHLLVSTRRLRVQTTVLERRKKEGKRAYVTSRTTSQNRSTKNPRFSIIIASTNYLPVSVMIGSVLDIFLGKRHLHYELSFTLVLHG